MNNKFRELNHEALMIWERELLLAHRLNRLQAVAHSGHHRLTVDPRTFALFEDYRNLIRAHRHQHGPTILDFSAAPPGLHNSFYLQAAEESGGHPHHVGGKRWSPTQEQLAVLETLYRKGMRTPSAQQIDRITAELVRYGRVEGKNVFYWFQNHKTRERQRERLDALPRPKPAAMTAASTSSSLEIVDSHKGKRDEEGENNGNKRKSRSWFIDLEGEINNCEEVKKPKTLELFPLHPSR